MADRIAILAAFGLSDQQARTYLALLEYPALNVGALAKAVQLPRNRAYEIVEQLEERGLAEILLTETRMVRAKPITEFLDSTVSALESRAEDLRARREVLAVAFEPVASEVSQSEPNLAKALIGRRSVAREAERLIAGAQRSLILVASRGGSVRALRHLLDAPASTLARIDDGSLELEVFLPKASISPGGLEPGLDRFARHVRWLGHAPASFAIIADERDYLLVHPIPDDERISVGGDRALLMSDSAFAADHARLLRAAAGNDAISAPAPVAG